ncbi:MAG: hypothetical protein IBJ03_13510 [Gemmatimonadaceae bacterium]|nr:hypothetical protein [Gemmatimonadaceae bacterium]
MTSTAVMLNVMLPARAVGAQEAVQALPVVISKERATCDLTRATSEALVQVWTRIRATLEQAEATQQAKKHAFELYQFERTLDPDGRVVRRIVQRTQSGNAFTSFTPRNADTLALHGYVREDASGATYFAPSAATLLSEPFLRTHCFQLQPTRGAGNSSVVVEFTPAASSLAARRFVDVAGAYWVDRATARLDSVQFRYVGLPEFVTAAQAGGTVAFARIADGPVFVSAWSMRMPRIGERPRANDDRLRRSTYSTERRIVVDVQEEGGVVLAASVGGASSLNSAYRANLPQVQVQLTPVPNWIARARVEVQGTSLSQRFDSSGSASLRVPPGRYTLAIGLPFGPSESLPLEGIADTKETRPRTMQLPDPDRLLRHMCEAKENGRGKAAVWGTVRDSLGRGVSNVPVNASWYGNVRLPTSASGDRLSAVKQEATTRTGSGGEFLLCSLPTGDVLIETQAGDAAATGRIKIADRDRLLPDELVLVLQGRGVR